MIYWGYRRVQEMACYAYLVIFVLGLTAIHLSNSQTISVKVCECNKLSEISAIKFEDEKCEAPPKPRVNAPVNYALFTNKPETSQVSGYVCTRWRRSKRISTFLFGQRVVTNDHMAIDTSPDECTIMKTRRTCITEPMDFKDGKWFYTREPSESGMWMQDVENHEIHCMLEEVTLVLHNDEESISTPIGNTNSSSGYYAHNHVTVIWDRLLTKYQHGVKYQLEAGQGDLIQEDGKLRLVDYQQQTDYHLAGIIGTPIRDYREFKVVNSDKLAIVINGNGKSEDKFLDRFINRKLQV